MNKTFPIDYVRQVIEQTLLEEHIKNPHECFGGVNQVNLFSFYEQLQKEDEVNRYVAIYNDLIDQQNRTGLIMNGTIIAPENPTITNLAQCLIIPMSFTCSFRVLLANRDTAINTINNLIDKLKGRKQDIALFESGKLFKVGTVANEIDGTPTTQSGDYIGEYDTSDTLNNVIENQIKPYFTNKGIIFDDSAYYYMGHSDNNHMLVVKKVNGEWTTLVESESKDILFPPTNESFEKYKISMSFDSIRCDEPRNLNKNEYCVISFGGSATITSKDVLMGNELTKLGIRKLKIVAKPGININGQTTWLEPLELPSNSNTDTLMNQLISNKFINNSHNDSLTLSNQYTFMVDKSIPLIKQWFRYGRYGVQASGSPIDYTNGITPNMIYEIKELWSSWGEVDVETFKAKLGESIEIENTESDTLTMTITMQIQGDNN